MASQAPTETAKETAIDDMAGGREGSVRQLVSGLVGTALRSTFPEVEGLEPLVAGCANTKFGDYQCNNAMGIWAKIKGSSTSFKNPVSVGQAIMSSLPESPMIEKTSIAGPGFVNIVLSSTWLEQRIESMLAYGIDTWAPKLPVSRVLVDFSSPNIAKEMHVGHLRSTIIGDTLARMLEYCQVAVLRRNHVGDWGTQFGMLIEHLFDSLPDWEKLGDQAVGDLQAFYKAAKVRFDAEPEFKERAQKAVVKLQGGDPLYRAAWAKICDVSRKEFQMVYERLQIELEEKGESSYNPYIPDTVKILEEKGLVEDSRGARCIFLPSKLKVKKPEKGQEKGGSGKEKGKKKGGEPAAKAPEVVVEPGDEGDEVFGQQVEEGESDERGLPLIIVKSDGGFNYATTDLACLWYRLNVEKGEWIVYVTDVGQSEHFSMLFEAAELAGWHTPKSGYPKLSHVGFGLVLGTDGKRFRTRSSEVVRLVDLLDEAVSRSRQGLVERGREGEWTEEEIQQASEALGYGAVKYADLKNNRHTNYTFDFDQMLDMRGNTAVYLLYAHARICSIIRKADREIVELKEIAKKGGAIHLQHPSERSLATDLVRFPEIVEAAVADLLPNILCEYLYSLSGSFTSFYTNCQVVGSEEETSRLLLCEATATVMRQCFHLLGIRPLYRL